MSFILISAISRSCAVVTRPTAAPLPGVVVPLVIPAAFFRKCVFGGVLVTKVNERSPNAVMTTGVGVPGSMPCVAALNSLTNAMMFSPRCPSAGPTGGDGFAFPAGICNLM